MSFYNHEETDFAASRFTPRESFDYSHFYAGRFYRPTHEHVGWRWARTAVCVLVGMAIGWMLTSGV